MDGGYKGLATDLIIQAIERSRGEVEERLWRSRLSDPEDNEQEGQEFKLGYVLQERRWLMSTAATIWFDVVGIDHEATLGHLQRQWDEIDSGNGATDKG